LLGANLEYERVTKKSRDDALGHFPSENWPGQTGKLIAFHDNIVRSTRMCYLTRDVLPFGTRVTLRFPIFVETDLDATATLGFHERLLELCHAVSPNQIRLWRFPLDLTDAREIESPIVQESTL